MKTVSIPGILHTAFLEGLYRPENCRIIPPEEYDRKYGEGDQDAE